MLVDERMTAYINSLNSDEAPMVRRIEQEAIADRVPIIRKETKELLKVLLRMKKPMHVLEVGTAVGFSAVLMSEYIEPESKIITIENYQKRIDKAKENFALAGKEHQIQLLEGDAMDILKTLEPPFDFIFMDAAKGQYINFYPEVKRLLAVGGTLVSDNVLQDGDIIESRYAVTRRNRTIHSRMREYLYLLKHADDLETVILPIGDGVAVSTKVGESNEKT